MKKPGEVPDGRWFSGRVSTDINVAIVTIYSFNNQVRLRKYKYET